jgi:glycerol-3-phosphate O-acyltransferase
MPVTATAAVTTILLAMHGAALTFGQIRLGLSDGLAYLDSRGIPRTASLRALSAPGPVRATLDALAAGGLVTVSQDGREPVWMIGPDQQLAATFYRNSLVHFLLDTALCELAVLRAGEAAGEAAGEGAGEAAGEGAGEALGEAAGDPLAAFWAEIAKLRDLLKFEFYFREREEHLAGIRAEMNRHDPRWEERLKAGPEGVEALLSQMRPLVSHIVVRPFVGAYRLVADVLVEDGGAIEEQEVIRRALGLGRQYVAQRRLRSSESVSVLLFQTALQLAANRGLLTDGEDVAARRAGFLAELRRLLHRLDTIEDMAIRRYVKDAVSASGAE